MDIINRSSDMVYYRVISIFLTKRMSARFIVIGKDILKGTKRLYPEKSAFTSCFVFFRRTKETNVYSFSSSNALLLDRVISMAERKRDNSEQT